MVSPIITVSQLIRYTKALLDEQKQLEDVLLSGEISDLAYRSFNGHLYFTVTDGTSTIKCVMFSKYAMDLNNDIVKGDKVIVRGKVGIYEKDGTVQLIAYDIQQKGNGIKKNSLDELKKKLFAEGLFSGERKLAFEKFPRAIGVITSPEGAALQDVIATMELRNPLVKIIVYPAVMQGTKSAESIIKALDFAEKEKLCENYIITRGGGSSDDLNSFNDETLARRVSAFPYPIVSAVGHEIDTTILDLVADARAATPTAACQIVSNSITDYKNLVINNISVLHNELINRYSLAEAHVKALQNRLSSMSVTTRIKLNEEKLKILRKNLDYAIDSRINFSLSKVYSLLSQIDLMNPLNVLKKGYSITQNVDGSIINPKKILLNDIMITKLDNFEIKSKVIDIKNKED